MRIYGRLSEHKLTKGGSASSMCKCFMLANKKGLGTCALCDVHFPTQRLSSDQSFPIEILGLGLQDLLSISRHLRHHSH